jgi:uncharacterized protein YdbL (DUF1318 family)
MMSKSFTIPQSGGGASPGVMRIFKREMIWAFLLLPLVGCTLADVRVDVVSERTTLENQVLGTYNALDQEMLLLASVRSVGPSGAIKAPPRRSQEHKDAVAAMQTQAFHADDLQALKRLGWVGENNEGLLTVFDMQKESITEDLKAFAGRYDEAEFKAVVAEINQAREVVMRRVIQMNDNFTEEDLPEVRRVFGRLNAQNALPGEKIQTEDGSWTVKK